MRFGKIQNTLQKYSVMKTKGIIGDNFANMVDEFGFTPLIRVIYTYSKKISEYYKSLLKEACILKCLEK